MFGAESVKFLKLKLWLLYPFIELCCLFYCSTEAQVAATVPTEAQSHAQGELISGVQQYQGSFANQDYTFQLNYKIVHSEGFRVNEVV